MAWLHGWVGLLAGWVLYAICLTGTLSYFQDEITAWMRPELASRQTALPADVYAQRVSTALTRIAPDARRWIIDLPSPRRAAPTASWVADGRHGELVFDAATAERVRVRDTAGAGFFYRFHYQLHYLPHVWGRWIVGLCTLLMLVALISGLVTHRKIFADFFTFRWGRGARSWLDAHNALSVLALPFHLMVAYSGLVMLAFLYMPWGAIVAYPQPQERQAALLAATSAPARQVMPGGRAASMQELGPMVREAQARWGTGEVGYLIVHNPGDAEASVVLVRGEASRVSSSPQYLHFHGVDGRLLHAQEAFEPVAETRAVLYALHMGRFGDTVLRWLYLLAGLAATAMVGTGLVLWTRKRRAQYGAAHPVAAGLRFVERLNLAAIVGLSMATASYFCLNRLLPLELLQRKEWEVLGFFLVWAAALLHACIRPLRRAWLEQLRCAALLLLLAPLLSALVTDRSLWRSLMGGDWVFVGVELSICIAAWAHALLAGHMERQGDVLTRPELEANRHDG